MSTKGIQALREYTRRGIKLIGCYCFKTKEGNVITPFRNKGDDILKGASNDISYIEYESESYNPIKVWKFVPAHYGFLCLDIDVKDGKDGYKEFLSLDVDHTWNINTMPYVRTPSGGYHLYFKYTGALTWLNKPIKNYPAIEVKYGMSGITAGGSYKMDKPYELFGNLDEAPELPQWLKPLMDSKQAQDRRYALSAKRFKKDDSPVADDIIWGWVDKASSGPGRNNDAYGFAIRALGHGWELPQVEAYLLGCPRTSGLTGLDIQTTVASAARKVR
jgi:hypothetical protein